jgi:ADP-heptose:LPS heptosyltransferase
MEAALAPGRVPVALHPGSSDGTPYKRWGSAAFGALARALHERQGIPCVVVFGPGRDDPRLAREVVEASLGAARLAPPTPSLRDLAALLASCRLYVGGDSGPLHVASLVGTPVVQLLGPTDPLENKPYPGTPSASVRVGLGCSPCRRGCAEAACMRLIEPEVVLRAAFDLLGISDAGADSPVRSSAPLSITELCLRGSSPPAPLAADATG